MLASEFVQSLPWNVVLKSIERPLEFALRIVAEIYHADGPRGESSRILRSSGEPAGMPFEIAELMEDAKSQLRRNSGGPFPSEPGAGQAGYRERQLSVAIDPNQAVALHSQMAAEATTIEAFSRVITRLLRRASNLSHSTGS